jgi:outer membrane protein assembly factor BamB
VNKALLLILIILFLNNCSSNKDETLSVGKKTNLQKTDKVKAIRSKIIRDEQEFNPTLTIQISEGKFGINSDNNQNNIGELGYQGFLEKIGKFNYKNFNDFEYIETKPIYYNDDIIFFDNHGTIISYDSNQNVIWKKNFYNKSEKKSRPRLNLAIQNNILIVTDSVAKYYAVDLLTREILWTRKNIVPFNSDIKIKDDFFYVLDYKNILRSISIKDGSEIWNLKTEESLTKSNRKLSITLDNENIYFNNSIGDITAVNILSGQLVWQLPTQNNNISKNAFQLKSSKLVMNENSILFSTNKNEFYSIDKKIGLINWKNKINSILRPTVIGKFIITVSSNGYLYLVDKKSGTIIRINDLYKNYKYKKRINVLPTGFVVAMNKIYLTNDDGKLIIADLNTGNILNIFKIAGGRISQPYVYGNNLLLIKNGSIIKYN